MDVLPKASVILGAGFSHAAGLPLAGQLFDSDVLVTSRTMERRFESVWAGWRNYRDTHSSAFPELFLQELYAAAQDPVGLLGADSLWRSAIALVAAALATPQGDDMPGVRNPRYAGRVTIPVRSAVHTGFWNAIIASVSLRSVVTLNYDILAERGLRHRRMKVKPRPGFYYGGFAQPQNLKGLAQPWSVHDPQRVVTLTGSVPLFKLHGSLSWADEGEGLVMYQDQRPALRSLGSPLVVPPIAEKERPMWLAPVWEGAASALSESDVWIVCGYSLPAYDREVNALLASCTADGPRRVLLLDPYADALLPRWQAVAPRATVTPLQGIPEGIAQLRSSLAGR